MWMLGQTRGSEEGVNRASGGDVRVARRRIVRLVALAR